jgi:hypothetical protein
MNGFHPEKGQERIPQSFRFRHIVGLERNAHPFLGEAGKMQGEMTPPGAVVVPQVMQRIVAAATNGELCVWIHNACFPFFFRTHQEGPKTKKPSQLNWRRHQVSGENIFSETSFLRIHHQHR